jgi:hypothetical protein
MDKANWKAPTADSTRSRMDAGRDDSDLAASGKIRRPVDAELDGGLGTRPCFACHRLGLYAVHLMTRPVSLAG